MAAQPRTLPQNPPASRRRNRKTITERQPVLLDLAEEMLILFYRAAHPDDRSALLRLGELAMTAARPRPDGGESAPYLRFI